ncbi:MAG: hypothetical protein M1825_002618 [Sarcosagium campestre]|nr:MAG: hypothetical protein M1825_002618 [Sarcosagium campestre]
MLLFSNKPLIFLLFLQIATALSPLLATTPADVPHGTLEPRRRSKDWAKNCKGSANCFGLQTDKGGWRRCLPALRRFDELKNYTGYVSRIYDGAGVDAGGYGCTLIYRCNDKNDYASGVLGAEIIET